MNATLHPVLAAAMGWIACHANGSQSSSSTIATDPGVDTGAEESPIADEADTTAWRFSIRGGAVHAFETDIDGAGDFSVDRFYIEPGVTLSIDDRTSYGVSFGAALDQYDFATTNGLAAVEPWDDVVSYRLNGNIRFPIDDRWTFFGLPTIRWSGEDGADFGDSLSGGALVGASYFVDEQLSIGPGIGVLTEIEDSVSVFPVLLINWQINDELSLRTGGGLAATQGPGLLLAWRFHEDCELLFGGRYENFRFRLDDGGAAPGGVGEEESIPLYAALQWQANSNTRIGVLAGVSVYGSLRLESSTGGFIAEQDYDPSPFVGLTISLEF